MTENESLSTTLQNAIDCATDDITREDLEMMVKCLEELQQYRAIGTIEEFKALKEKNETLKALYYDARKEGANLLANARAKAIDECIRIIEETVWKDTDMLVESIRELKGGAE